MKTTGTLELNPGIGNALAGLWTITWKSQFTWRLVWRTLLFVVFVPAFVLLTVQPGQASQYLRWALGFYLFLMLPLHCLVVFGPLIRDELQADTIGFLLTRPISRGRLFVLKFICQQCCVQTAALASGLLLLASGLFARIDDLGTLLPLLLIGQAMAVLVYGALGALMGLISRKYMVLGVVYGFIVEWGIGSIPTNIHSLAMSHHVRGILANSEIVANSYGDWVKADPLVAAGIMVAAAVIFLTVGAVLFTMREFHHSDEMQK